MLIVSPREPSGECTVGTVIGTTIQLHTTHTQDFATIVDAEITDIKGWT